MNQMPSQTQAQPNQMPAFDQRQFQQVMMQYLMQQLMNPQQNQMGQQNGMQQPQQDEEGMPHGWEEFKKFLMGGSEAGLDPHFSALENILQRLNGPGGNAYKNPFGMGTNSGVNMTNNLNSSAMNAQRLANQPLSNMQKAGQFIGSSLEDTAGLIGKAGSVAFGPLMGGLAGGAAYGTGKLLNYASQPYQLPTRKF